MTKTKETYTITARKEKAYLVVSINELNALLKIAKQVSRDMHNGKYRGSSCVVIRHIEINDVEGQKTLQLSTNFSTVENKDLLHASVDESHIDDKRRQDNGEDIEKDHETVEDE